MKNLHCHVYFFVFGFTFWSLWLPAIRIVRSSSSDGLAAVSRLFLALVRDEWL